MTFGKRPWQQHNAIAQRIHTLKCLRPLFALAALAALLGEANSSSPFKTLLNHALWKALLDPLRELTAPSSVLPQLCRYTSIQLLFLLLFICLSHCFFEDKD